VFDKLYAKVDALMHIANARFLHKRVTVGPDGLGVATSDGSPLELEMLSSGEQHELVMIYDLLFRVPDNSLILIDEPELSLHIVWQEQFLSDLEEMAKLSNFQAILATHSPQIIGDRWELTTELKGPNGE
jgi:predicted ATP-binding protein involved in virulence